MSLPALPSLPQQTVPRLFSVAELRNRYRPDDSLESRRFQGDINFAELDAALASLEEEEFAQAHEIPPDEEKRIQDFEDDELLDEIFQTDEDWAAFNEPIDLEPSGRTW
jgi:hypothetical protein